MKSNQSPPYQRRPIPPKPLPAFEKFAEKMSLAIGQTFMLTFGQKVREIVKFRDELPPDTKANLVRNLRKVAKEAEEFASQIDA